MMAKIIATLYLVYPASRGARKIFRRWVEVDVEVKDMYGRIYACVYV
jgi:endonuclease YncB( thermonuclease family)